MPNADASNLRFLGPVALQRDGQAPSRFPSRKAIALLGYLVQRAQPQRREELVELLWPELDEARGRANLSVVLHGLSSLLPGCFQADRLSVAWRPSEGVWVDTVEFDSLVAQPHPRRLARAVDLVRGEFMAGLQLDECPEAQAWLEGRREAWRGRLAAALAALIDHAGGRGAHAEALAYARRWLESEPWREEAHRAAMWHLACAGQPGAALAQLEACRRALEHELGVAPSAETVALAERIRAGDIERLGAAGTRPLAPPHPHNLPLQLTAFIGREEELSTIAERLADPSGRLITLVGPGGSGKSRLALEAAAAHLAAFPDGVYLVPLAAVSAVEGLPVEIAGAIGLALDPETAPLAQLQSHLGQRRMLLLLDNVEQLLGGADAVLELLRAAPALRLIVTSQVALDLRAEWQVKVRGLPFPGDGANGAAGEYAAVALFAERARHRDACFRLDEATAGPVAAICRRLEGLPLAIELAAAWAGDMPCGLIASEIAGSLDGLATTMRDVAPRHRSMRAVFEPSWRLLSSDLQAGLAALSVFPGAFGPEAAAAVAGTDPGQLEALAGRHLAQRASGGRLQLHGLLRAFAAEKLDGPATAATRGRHADWFARLAVGADLALQGPEQKRWLDLLSAEHDNLQAGLGWFAEAGPATEGLALATELWRFWLIRGHVADGRTWLTRLLALPDRADTPAGVRARARNAAGILAMSQGDAEAAREPWAEALAIHRQAGDRRSEASVLNNLANLHDELGDFAAARRMHEDCLAIRRELGPPREVAISLNNLGLVRLEQGDLEEARAAFAESLDIKRGLDDRRGQAMTLINLGILAERQGRPRAAAAHLTECLALVAELDDRSAGAEALTQLAGLLGLLGKPERGARLLGAQDALREALDQPIPPADQADHTSRLDALRQALGEAAFDAAREAGRRLPFEAAVAEARRAVAGKSS